MQISGTNQNVAPQMQYTNCCTPNSAAPAYTPNCQIQQPTANYQVPSGASAVNIQIFNPAITPPGALAPTYNVNAPSYPANYYTNQYGTSGCPSCNPINNSNNNNNVINQNNNPYKAGGLLDPNDTTNPYGADPYNPNNPYRPGGAFDPTNPNNPYKVGAESPYSQYEQNPYAPGGKLDPNNPNNPYGADPNNPNNPYRPGGAFDPTNKNNPYTQGLNSPTHPQSPGNPYRAGGPLDGNNPNNPYGADPYNPNNPYRPGGIYDPTNPNSPYKIINPQTDPNSPSNPYRAGGPLDPNDRNNPYGADPSNPNNPYRPGGEFDPTNPNNKYGAGGLLNPNSPISPYYNGLDNQNPQQNSQNSNNNVNTTTNSCNDQKTEKKQVVMLTDEYIKNLENYLNSQDKNIRLNAAKEVFARLDEDTTRKDDKALTALINKMLQDPSEEVKLHALAALEGRICNGDAVTVQLLQNIQQTNGGYGQDAIDASKILLQMSGQNIEKEVPVDNLKRTKFKSPEFPKDTKSEKKDK